MSIHLFFGNYEFITFNRKANFCIFIPRKFICNPLRYYNIIFATYWIDLYDSNFFSGIFSHFVFTKFDFCFYIAEII